MNALDEYIAQLREVGDPTTAALLERDRLAKALLVRLLGHESGRVEISLDCLRATDDWEIVEEAGVDAAERSIVAWLRRA